MARSERLRQHLSSLYRPEPGSDSLMGHFLDALGFSMDQAQQHLTQVMQSHWLAYADKASFDEHAQRDRERRALPPYNVRDAADQLEIALYPYIEDLARHGKLVSIPPWTEPPNQKDLVENYRRRIRKIMAIYRNGLGTMAALRTMVEAELPWTLENPLPERIRSFAIEEGISLETTAYPVTLNGVPTDIVGALMRWTLSRGEARTVSPTLLIHGVAPLVDEIEATENPMIERYDPEGNGLIGIALAYAGTLAAGESLRFKPARRSWLTGANGLRESPLVDDSNTDADPSANGPWTTVTDSTAIAFDCLYSTACGSLWMAGEQQLWRFDGDAFSRILDDETFTDIHCLVEHNKRLYIGCDDGLFVTDLYPGDDPYTRSAITELAGVAIHQVILHQGEFWLATGEGPRRMLVNPDQSISLESPLFASATYCLLFAEQARYFGCDLGLLRYDVAEGLWHGYHGETDDEPQLNWMVVDPDDLPAAEELGLPPIRTMVMTPDQALWLGADEGLARYYARHERDLLYRAVLEAFPDLLPGAVHQLRSDDRGMLWIASEQGLFRFDGRDLAQYLSGDSSWRQLGRADSIYANELAADPRGQWRFSRVEERWEQFDFAANCWTDSSLPVLSDEEDPVNQVLLTDSVVAHIGTWDGAQFSPQTPVPAADIRMRCKPDPQTIVDGGPPFIPSLPGGQSTWRYLQLEQELVTPPDNLPWWSREGRLFPPPEMQDVHPGRYRLDHLAGDGLFNESIFAYLPSARVTMLYANALALAVNVRLFRRGPDDAIDPAILDRVFAGINHVRPAGVPVTLSVENKLMRGATS